MSRAFFKPSALSHRLDTKMYKFLYCMLPLLIACSEEATPSDVNHVDGEVVEPVETSPREAPRPEAPAAVADPNQSGHSPPPDVSGARVDRGTEPERSDEIAVPRDDINAE